MQGNGIDRQPAAGSPDGALWRRSRMVEMVEDEADRLLDLAGFADGRLDPDDRERVAEWLAGDPAASGDVAAARALADAAGPPEAAPDAVVARACALVGRSETQRGMVIPFAPQRPARPRLHGMASWGSLVAAMAVASWLGFTLGMDTSLSVAQMSRAGDDGFLQELLDPSTGFMSGLTEGAQT
jgi:anti-sigma factor RsiW